MIFGSFSPLYNNSEKSHSITINKKIKINQQEDKVFIINGTPVDCVIFGVKYLSINKVRPSIILSGVNYGQNMGLDLLYSGTAAAAREGSILGIQSFSVSLEKQQSSNWNTAKYYIPKIISSISKLGLDSNIFYNINIPNKAINKVKGCKIVNAGKRKPGELSKVVRVNSKTLNFLFPQRETFIRLQQSMRMNTK